MLPAPHNRFSLCRTTLVFGVPLTLFGCTAQSNIIAHPFIDGWCGVSVIKAGGETASSRYRAMLGAVKWARAASSAINRGGGSMAGILLHKPCLVFPMRHVSFVKEERHVAAINWPVQSY